MCLAVPGKVIALNPAEATATVDYEAERRTVGTALLPDVAIGDYVLVQARMIVERVPKEEAQAFLETLKR